ncbi:hypothetical protein KAFR_0I00160 [Kazachstania africana CBS 2517]|uniref:Enoyl reductase (ER) domain-containing protein n=1 Tax=Kazachstania africana (strain ATCC 22294 / BCRC 22015 / CBS 2517 / CECT 1963 / NBRC 1671 / NRRL Y-8276) TaxID=1071382 RepID=H2AZJ7_KAZAF|nr:hypothetical protein KAFR_0I00160 [Kazachstania africana CBS 2517]CCF59797.1 hypothetical protein KAFR_0I00160 [Kazachstania africana CBS 2517]
MRALAYFAKGDIHFTKDLVEPKISTPDELILEINYCGICGTDLHEYIDGPIFFPEDGETNELSGSGLPQAMGHEIAGTVVKIGPKVTKFKVGDHVVVQPNGTCKDRYRWPHSPHVNKPWCSACKKGHYNVCSNLGLIGNGVQSGGCAERMCINESHCFKVPKDMPMDIAALIQPIAVSWHAIKVARFKRGGSVLVIGGGPIGLCTLLALQGHGCSDIVVSEPAKVRRELAERMGATTYDPSQHNTEKNIQNLRKMILGGDGFDYVFDNSGTPETLETAIECLTVRGTAVNVAMWPPHKRVEFSPMAVTKEEKIYTGSMCYTQFDFEGVIDAFERGLIDKDIARHMITAKVPIEDGLEDAILRLITHKEQTIKLLLTPNLHGELDS